MRTRANKNYVVNDRARRENVPRHILCSARQVHAFIARYMIKRINDSLLACGELSFSRL